MFTKIKTFTIVDYDEDSDFECKVITDFDQNLFDIEDFQGNKYESPVLNIYQRVYSVRPNSVYTVSTTMPNYGEASAHVFAGLYPFTPSTVNNGVLFDSPRTINSGNNGIIAIGIRENSDAFQLLVDGVYKIQLNFGLNTL